MIDPRSEEQAALCALGWVDDAARLEQAASNDPELQQALREFGDAAGMLAYDAPQVEAPQELRSRVMNALAAEPSRASRVSTAPVPAPRRKRRRVSLPRIAALPYFLAACLMGLALLQAALILHLNNRLAATVPAAPRHDNLAGVQLVNLAPQGDHGNAKIMVAWNGKTGAGMISMSDMPEAPAGKDYQVWILDPSKPAPISVGVVPHGVHTQHFVAGNMHMPGRPGFAVSLEPAGGRPVPSDNAILFAVAPSP